MHDADTHFTSAGWAVADSPVLLPRTACTRLGSSPQHSKAVYRGCLPRLDPLGVTNTVQQRGPKAWTQPEQY
eukprot:5844569-Amphidinium_carterae.1